MISKVGLFLIGLVAILLRLRHIEFGLPHSFHADEPEITELAIKYTYEIKDYIGNNNWYKMIPISFVYGTFPTYIFTFATMTFSKVNGLLGIGFEKMHIYVFLRVLTALISLALIPLGATLYRKLFKDKLGTWITIVLIALNWKLIVHAHYVNMDIFLTVLLMGALLTSYCYYKKSSDTLYTTLTGILMGLAFGTKFTALLTVPLFLTIFIHKRDYRGMFAFLFIMWGTFMATNPFSIVFADKFAFRIFTMLFKEAGLVFDSVDSRPLKYVLATGMMSTMPVFLFSLYGKFKTMRNNNKERFFHLFLIGQILLYLAFYSIQTRRVDRWMLPILPIVLLYGARGISLFLKNLKRFMQETGILSPKRAGKDKRSGGSQQQTEEDPAYRSAQEGILILAPLTIIGISLCAYLFYTTRATEQFQRDTPKSAAYKWLQENVTPASNKLVYTEEGLDPINKLPGARVIKYKVYEPEGAQFFIPENPEGYDYVILSSRPMQNHKRPEIREKYEYYYEFWHDFETTVQNPNEYELVQAFTLSKPNLIPLSDVFIYKNLNTITK
jgi:hypothetical protein